MNFAKSYLFMVFMLAMTLIINNLYNRSIVYASNKQITISALHDLYVESNFPNTITYNQRNLFIGYDSVYNKGITRLYFRPNYQQLMDKHIQPDQILSVKAFFHLYYGDNQDKRILIYKINENWDQAYTTYNNQPDSTYYNYKNITSSNNGIFFITLTTAFKQDYQRFINDHESYGFMVKYANEQQNAIRAWSNECLQAQGEHCNNPDDIPNILVEYKDNTMPRLGIILSPINNPTLTNSTISFIFTKATDPDNDPLQYRIVITRDANQNNIVKTTGWVVSSNIFSDTQNTGQLQLSIGDGTWFWHLEVKDDYNNRISSDSYKFTVDTTPPEIPEIVAEPPYTKGLSNTIYINVPNIEEGEHFQFQASVNRDFSANIISSPWLLDTSFTFNRLKEAKYYYRVRAIDSFGNMSPWSNIAWSIQDNTVPNIEYFKISKKILGPQDLDVSIRAKFYDPTLYKVKITLFNNKKLLDQYEVQNTNYVYKKFDIRNLKSGIYYSYAQALDQFGHEKISKPIQFIIDKQPPQLNVIGEFTKTRYLNTMSVNSQVRCIDYLSDISNTIYLNNKKLFVTNKNKFTYRFHLKDAKYTLAVNCTDQAGNKIRKSFPFTIDTTPPKKPQLTFKLNKDKTQAIVQSKCANNEKLYLYFNKRLYTATCSHGYSKVTLKELGPGNTYSITAYLKDLANNKSPTNTLLIKIPNSKPRVTSLLNIVCFVTYDASKFQYIVKNCKYKKKLDIQSTGVFRNNHYEYKVYLNIPQTVHLFFKKVGCKTRNLWDIRTWFMCVPQEKEIYNTTASLILNPVIEGHKYSIRKMGSKQYVLKIASNTMLKNIKISINTLLIKNFFPELYLKTGVLFLKIKNPMIFSQTVVLPYIRKPVSYSRPLSWMFSRYYHITQWFGHTCYEHWHTGIDIGVYKKPVLASADGIIVSFGTHYAGKKLSGGKWIGIRHPNGLHTYYWHLQQIGTSKNKLYIGKHVKRGEPIGISGNSGWYNYIRNPYHLHFEVRTSRAYKDCIDPTRYLNINWNTFPVCQAKCCSSGYDPRR